MLKGKFAAALERAEKATPGEWSTLGEECEVHAIEFAEGDGDPLHICESVNNKDNAEFIAHARTDIPAFAKALSEAIEEFKEIRDEALACISRQHAWDQDQFDKELEAIAKIATRVLAEIERLGSE